MGNDPETDLSHFNERGAPGVRHVRTLEQAPRWLGGVAFDPTGYAIASGSSDNVIRRWKATNGELLTSYEVDSNGVWTVAFGRGVTLAAGCKDGTVWVWEAANGKLIRVLPGHAAEVNCVVFLPGQNIIASASDDNTINIWDVAAGRLLHTSKGHESHVNSVAFAPDGRSLASGSSDKTVRLWDTTTGKLLRTFGSHDGSVDCVTFDPTGNYLASSSSDKTIKLWDAGSGKLLRTLEGHTGAIGSVVFSSDGRVLLSKSADGTLRTWSCRTWETVAVVREQQPYEVWSPGLAADPTSAQVVSSRAVPDSENGEHTETLSLWQLDYNVLFASDNAVPSVHYVNAKVVLVGDTGVGKSGLSLVLNRRPFEATDSTPGRHVWTFDTSEVALDGYRKQTRETLLWDLAGQPGYRVIHQLHLNEVAVALVVFDARSETDPLAGVRHWERALRLAHQRQSSHPVPTKKFLVSARTDRGGVSVSKDRIATIRDDFGFDGYFETSAKEGWQIKDLREAIERAIPWNELPVVTSERMFEQIKEFLLNVKTTGLLLAQATQLYDDFRRVNDDVHGEHESLLPQFETCIGRLENRDLIRQLSFGGYVLLQPELLDAYGSAIVIAAKNEPDGLGSIAEDVALAGRFFVPEEQRVVEKGQEQLLLHATIEELVRHDLALRENAEDGRHLVFPSQFNRDFEDAREPKGLTVAITFDGPVQSIYSTLAVRLGHSGLFETGRTEMWRNAAIFTARAGGKCGLYMREFSEARGQIMLFFEPDTSDETQFYFEDYVLSHLSRRAIKESVELVRFFVCAGCLTPVPDAYVKMCVSRGIGEFACPCGELVSLADFGKVLGEQYPSQVEAMDRSADRRRDFDMFIVSASGETHTRSFLDWVGGERAMLAIVFTDVVASTQLENRIGGEHMSVIRRAHFAQGRRLLEEHNGREVKTIGDSFMAAFRTAEDALDFAISLRAEPGDPYLRIRAGIHVGAMQVEGNDVFGGPVNFAARVVGAAKGPEIWVSDRAKEDIDTFRAKRHRRLKWEWHTDVSLKGFPGVFTLWSLRD